MVRSSRWATTGSEMEAEVKGVKVYFNEGQNYLSFDKVTEYKLKKGFLIMRLNDGKCIAYNISRIYKFEVD